MSLQQMKDELRRVILKERGFVEPEEPGVICCPNCGEHYRPMYEEKRNAPRGTIWHEQHITGVCSQKCWDEFTGGPP